MSVVALKFAMSAQVGRASEKLVLIMLAWHADDDGRCYPSVATIADETVLDRKTVLRSLKSLEASGFVSRAHRVGSVSVYRVPVPEVVPVPEAGRHQCQNRDTPSTKNGPGPVPKTGHRKDKDQEKTKKRERTPSAQKPDDVSQGVWDQYLAHRAKKRASVTSIVIEHLRKEAALAGISLEDAMRECIVRGWQGFYASWYKRATEQQGSGGRPRSSSSPSGWVYESQDERDFSEATIADFLGLPKKTKSKEGSA